MIYAPPGHPNPRAGAPSLSSFSPHLPLQPGTQLLIPVEGEPVVVRDQAGGYANAKSLIGPELDTVNLWNDHVMFVDDFGAPVSISLVKHRAKGLPINPLATSIYQGVRGTINNIYGPAVIVRDSDFA